MENKLIIKNTGKTYFIITTFKLDKYKKDYIVYSEDETSDEVMVNSYKGPLKEAKLYEIKNNKEWNDIELFLNTYLKEK